MENLVRRLKSASTGLFFALLCTASGAAQAFFVAGPSQANVDTGAPTVINFNVTRTGTIANLAVQVSLNDAIDGSDGVYWDNVVVMLSHNGTDVTLMNYGGTDDAGGNSSFFGTFSDTGYPLPTPARGGYTQGYFLPVDALAAFAGMELSGTWTVTVYDNSPFPNDGTDLAQFNLTGSFVGEAVPTMPLYGLMLTAVGLIAAGTLALRRRRKLA